MRTQVYRGDMETTRADVEFLWTNRIKAEYREMPGMRLTAAQASRLWGLEQAHCHVLLEALVGIGYLRRTAHGAYVLEDGARNR